MKNPSRATIILLAGAALIAVPTATARAATNTTDPDTSIKFSFSPPGARSLALGGAFLALADDATAAYTNPAGLTNLTLGGSEVAVELRQNQFSNSYVDRGHFGEAPTNIGVDFEAGFLRNEVQSTTSGLSFLSFAYVLPRGLTLAFYRHALGNFSTRFQTQGAFAEGFRYLPRQSETELEIVNSGLSGAYELKLPPLKGMESTLSIGLGVSYYELDLRVRDEYFDLDRFGIRNTDDPATKLDDREPGNFYGPPDYRHDNLFTETGERGDDSAFGVNLGFLWKLGKEQRWSVGGVFRKGPDFATKRTATCGPQNPDFPCTAEQPPPGVFTVPDVIGLGLAYRTAEGKTKILFDLNRVRYSQRLDSDLRAVDFRIKDADQLHLGVERTVLVVESLFVGTARFGAWREPFHELEYFGDVEQFAAFLRRPKDAEIHYSAGFGLVIKEDYQIDFAADLSDPNDTFSFSLVKFF